MQLKKVLHEEEKRRRKEQRWDQRAKSKIGSKVDWVTKESVFNGKKEVTALGFHLPYFHSSDLTTLTSAAYQQSLTVHTGTHLLSMQGKD